MMSEEGYRGCQISVRCNGEVNRALTMAVDTLRMSKQKYAEEALQRCLIEDGFLP